MINVFLVDDQRLFREGLEAIIRGTDDIHVIGMAENGKDAIPQIEKQLPDVVLMDICMPHLDGIKATVYLKEHYPSVKVVMLTSEMKEDHVIEGISVGADGFLLKELYVDTFLRSIRETARGEFVFSGEVARILAANIRDLTLNKKQIFAKRLEHRGIQLINRDLDIAYLFMQGNTNKHIAEQLFLSEGTVKNYISALYSKLDVRNRARAVAYLRKIME